MNANVDRPPFLQVSDLTWRFGSFIAVNRVSFSVKRGEVHAVIGPNGAGKTTLFRLMTGVLRPTSGSLKLDGMEIGGKKVHSICRLGVSQVFQITSLFPNLTVLESVCAAIVSRERRAWHVAARVGDAARREALELLDQIGLADFATSESDTLSHGDQRALGIGVALATKAKLLLLDEPTAGMSPFETEHMVELIRKLVDTRDLTVVLSEHDMDTVFGLSDRVTVMSSGEVLADGAADEVRANEAVMSVYLGGAHEPDAA